MVPSSLHIDAIITYLMATVTVTNTATVTLTAMVMLTVMVVFMVIVNVMDRSYNQCTHISA